MFRSSQIKEVVILPFAILICLLNLFLLRRTKAEIQKPIQKLKQADR